MTIVIGHSRSFDGISLPGHLDAHCSFTRHLSRDRDLHTTMVSLARTIRSIRRVGIKEWWHQMQYIGDAKSGTFKGKDQCVA